MLKLRVEFFFFLFLNVDAHIAVLPTAGYSRLEMFGFGLHIFVELLGSLRTLLYSNSSQLKHFIMEGESLRLRK